LTSHLDDNQKIAISKALADMLALQMMFSVTGPVEVTKIETKKGRVNRKALGYIYGFIDCALQSRGEDIADVSVGVPIVFHVLQTLFPGHERAYVEFLLSHMDDEVMMLGMMTGGQQYADFIVKPGAKGAPMGFARLLLEGSPE
jgi:hypothetical protein